MCESYKNQFGEVIMENLDRFEIRGKIVSERVEEINDSIGVDVTIENSDGKHRMIIWDSVKGFNLNKIKQGNPIRVFGLIRKQGYTAADGSYKYYDKYSVQEIA